ncbi:MAG: hypothetical protein HY791_35435 [Deltaproteobacteria bacterium]|nr:hypothetical protein [Deltaproteobacteria bacterium]
MWLQLDSPDPTTQLSGLKVTATIGYDECRTFSPALSSPAATDGFELSPIDIVVNQEKVRHRGTDGRGRGHAPRLSGSGASTTVRFAVQLNVRPSAARQRGNFASEAAWERISPRDGSCVRG